MSYFAKTTYSARIIARKLLYPIYNSLCINLGTQYFFSEEYTPLPSKGLFGLGAVGDTVSKNITSGTIIKKPSQKISLSPEISQTCLESYQVVISMIFNSYNLKISSWRFRFVTIGFIIFYYLPITTNATVLTTGATHTCGIGNDNHLTCWGENKWGQITPPDDRVFIQVSAGRNYTCGIQTDNTVVCWGQGDDGQITPPNDTFSQISVGFEHACGIRTDSTVACWGNNDYDQSSPPDDNTFFQISAGKEHTCGLRTNNTVVCWGRSGNSWNDNPAKNIGDQITPPNDTTFSQISAGGWHTCGIRVVDGQVICWGHNGDSQASPPEGHFSQISAGQYYTCGIKTDKTVACWGWNEMGQAKPPNSICISRPDKKPTAVCSAQLDMTFSHVSAGKGAERDVHTCGILTDNTVVCWGYNGESQATPPPCLRLKSSNSNAQAEENLAYGILYGVHADGNKDSQFFTVDSRTLEANPFGELYKNYDITAIDSYPITHQIFAVSGEKAGKKKGYLYQVDRSKGMNLSELGKTGFKVVTGITFHPDGTLWGWAQGDGLFKIEHNENDEPDLSQVKLVLPDQGTVEIEDLTWNSNGTTLYAVENLYEEQTRKDEKETTIETKGTRLWHYTQAGTINTVCDKELNTSMEKIEAIETISSDSEVDTLLFHFGGHEELTFGLIDTLTCQISQVKVPANYYAIERVPKNNYFGERNYSNIRSLAFISCQD